MSKKKDKQEDVMLAVRQARPSIYWAEQVWKRAKLDGVAVITNKGMLVPQQEYDEVLALLDQKCKEKVGKADLIHHGGYVMLVRQKWWEDNFMRLKRPK